MQAVGGLRREPVDVRVATLWGRQHRLRAACRDAASKRFVEAFRKEYGYVPSNISAQAYESAKIIDAAVTQVKGKVEDRDAFVKAIEQVKFDSVRGPFRYGKNHFPVQSFYATEVARLPDGKLIESNKGLIVKDDVDPYAAECPMK